MQYIVDPFGNPGADIIGQVYEILSLRLFRFLCKVTKVKKYISYMLNHVTLFSFVRYRGEM